jgi:site-specific recombinase XerD
MAEVKLNMLRERANKIDEVTDEMWNMVLKENRDMVKEYLSVNTQLSPDTLTQYTSGLRQFFWWVHENLNDKPFYKITKREFMRYLSYITERGLSSSAIGFKKSSVSSFNNYIENVVSEDMEECKGFRNFTRGLPAIGKNQVYDKIPINEDEYKKMMAVLEKEENYLGMAWVSTAFNVGARRGELIQLKTEIVNYPIPEGKNYVLSHVCRGKGSGRDGKPLKYMINLDALKYMKLLVENRDFESDYIFSLKKGDKIHPLSRDWANYFCQHKLSSILGRRINPHLFKSSCITYLLEKGVDLKVVSKYVAQHNDTSTTSNFYDLRDFEEEKDSIFS